MDAVQTYKAARASGKKQGEACQVAIREHGITCEQAADICWHVETGGPKPSFLTEDGALTKAGQAWYAGADSSHNED